MSENTAEGSAPLGPEQRRQLAKDTLRAVSLLAESLEQSDDADAVALLARVQAAFEPVRGVAALTGSGTLTAGGAPVRLGELRGEGTLSVGVAHVLQVHDTAQAQDSANAVVVAGSGTATFTVTASATGYAVPTGTGGGGVSWTGTGTGSAPETFAVTADDVPWLLWQILLHFDDMAADKRGLSGSDITNWVASIISVLGALVTVLTL